MEVIESIRETSTYLEIKYTSRSLFSGLIGWLCTGIWLISFGCFGLWYTSTHLLVEIQLSCERVLNSQINCRLDSSTFLEQHSLEIRELQKVQLRRIEDDYQVILISAFDEIETIADSSRPSLEKVVNQVNAFIDNPQSRTLKTRYDLRWKVISLLGFIGFWLICVLVMFPMPLDSEFRYICIFERGNNQVTRWSCSLLKKRQQTWQLDAIQNVQLDEEQIEDGICPGIALVLNSGETIVLLSQRHLPIQRTQLGRAVHRIRQFLNLN